MSAPRAASTWLPTRPACAWPTGRGRRCSSCSCPTRRRRATSGTTTPRATAAWRRRTGCCPPPATTVYALDLHDPQADLPRLREQYPDAGRDLVYLHFTCTAGKDNLEAILRELEDLFPRWYARDWTEAGALGPALTVEEANR